jgi:hypothetical protein
MNNKVEYVEYQEALSIKVGRWLLQKGFDLASCAGVASSVLIEADSLGILWKDPDAKPIKRLFGLIKLEPRRCFIGTIWFNNSARGTGEQKWILEVYGREHIAWLRQVAEEMASTFNVKICLRLVREQPAVETYLSDYSA